MTASITVGGRKIYDLSYTCVFCHHTYKLFGSPLEIREETIGLKPGEAPTKRARKYIICPICGQEVTVVEEIDYELQKENKNN